MTVETSSAGACIIFYIIVFVVHFSAGVLVTLDALETGQFCEGNVALGAGRLIVISSDQGEERIVPRPGGDIGVLMTVQAVRSVSVIVTYRVVCRIGQSGAMIMTFSADELLAIPRNCVTFTTV